MKKSGLITLIAAIVCCSFIAGKNLLVDGAKFRLSGSVKINNHFSGDTTEALPKAYVKRKFLNDISGVGNDVFNIPGNIVSYNAKDTSYTLRTLHGIIKGNKKPVSMAISDGLIYNNIITSKTSFNGSYLIGGLSAKPGEALEISIQDESISSVQDSLIDIEKIKAAAAAVPETERQNLYFVKSVTVTGITSKLYTQAKFDATKNGFYLVLNGKTYGTTKKGSKYMLISMYLVPLADLFSSSGK